MAGGAIFGALFFLLLAFAAITSIIALIEPVVSYAGDKWKMSRLKACVVFGFLLWLFGIATVLSFNHWSGVAPLGMVDLFAGMTVFDLIDYFTANILMPLGGILIALFVGWKLRPEVLAEELPLMSPMVLKIWLVMIRIVVPIAIVAVLYDTFS
jgi:NSS family neurotransmitter:Na+ symporter